MTYLAASKMAHPMNAPCPDCQCPKWLHTVARCLTLRVADGTPNAPKLVGCQCARRAGDFA